MTITEALAIIREMKAKLHNTHLGNIVFAEREVLAITTALEFILTHVWTEKEMNQ